MSPCVVPQAESYDTNRVETGTVIKEEGRSKNRESEWRDKARLPIVYTPRSPFAGRSRSIAVTVIDITDRGAREAEAASIRFRGQIDGRAARLPPEVTGTHWSILGNRSIDGRVIGVVKKARAKRATKKNAPRGRPRKRERSAIKQRDLPYTTRRRVHLLATRISRQEETARISIVEFSRGWDRFDGHG